MQNLQFFFKDNQAGEEVTQIDYLGIIGTPIGTTNMNEFKRVSGKKGEGHWWIASGFWMNEIEEESVLTSYN